MIVRENGKIVFCCDMCSDTIDTEEKDFAEALKIARKIGWLFMKDGGNGWAHICPTCNGEGIAQ